MICIQKLCTNCSYPFTATHFAMSLCHGCMGTVKSDYEPEFQLHHCYGDEERYSKLVELSKGGDLYE